VTTKALFTEDEFVSGATCSIRPPKISGIEFDALIDGGSVLVIPSERWKNFLRGQNYEASLSSIEVCMEPIMDRE
jgi:hypothetical protein